MHFELRNKSFFTKTFKLMLPVILQQLITVGINFLDNLMIGGFGETQIAAAAFGNQFYSLFQFICMGLGSGAVVMSSQFWGRKELEPMRVTAAIALRVTVAICAAFTLIAVLFPSAIMRCFTNDAAIIAEGTPYMRLIGTTFLLAGLSSTATYLLRSVGTVNISLIGSIVAFLLNLFFNWVFIFGKFGVPRLELVGAAVGTIIARMFEFCFVFGYFVFKDDKFAFRLKHFILSGAGLLKQYVKFSVPVLVSDTLLGLSLSLTSVIVGHVGENLAAASSIVGSAVQLISVVNVGMSGASAVVIGNTIGEGDIPRAKREGNTYILISILFGLLVIPVLMLLENPYIGMYNITDTTREITHGMLVCTYFMLPIQTMAYVTSKGILRGGGDTKFLLFADSTMVWFVSLPLGALSGLVWNLGPVITYFFLRVEFPLKGLICLARYITGKWVKEISAKTE
ncbi:MAG: MATE family efflux transporter [Ruminococcaceae bacterium]|nr:MATE family efflux transporter [Oscillospiraceae bacterium]